MIVPQTKLISETSDSRANSAPLSSTIGIVLHFALAIIVSSRLVQIILLCLQTLL